MMGFGRDGIERLPETIGENMSCLKAERVESRAASVSLKTKLSFNINYPSINI